MYQLVEFVGNHPFLFIALGAVSGLLVWNMFAAQLRGVRSLSPQEATLLINREDAIIIDVRDEGEYKQGHIINALHIPSSDLMQKVNMLEKYRNRAVIINCMTGDRSIDACVKLKKQGFEKVYNLQGGIFAWHNASLPLTKE